MDIKKFIIIQEIIDIAIELQSNQGSSWMERCLINYLERFKDCLSLFTVRIAIQNVILVIADCMSFCVILNS